MYGVELSAFCNEVERIRAAEALPHQYSPPFFSPKPELVSRHECMQTNPYKDNPVALLQTRYG
jgi:hypothetical protein